MNGTTQIIKGNRYLLWIVFWLFLASVCLSQNAKAPLIANLTRSHMTGCGCYFGFPEREGSWVLEADDGDSVAWVNINGVDTKLKLDRSTFAQKEFEVNDKFSEFYSGSSYQVEVHYVVKRLPTEKDYEWTKMTATIIVRRGATKSVLRLDGGCGC